VNLSNEINNELIFKIDKAAKCMNIERDLELYSEHNNYYNENRKRFLPEKFLDYKLFMNEDKSKKNISRENLSLNKDILQKYLKIINLGKSDNSEDKQQNKDIKIELKTEEEKNINNYLMSLVKEEIKLDEKKCEYINEYIKKKPDNIKLVMDILLNQLKNSSFIKVNNLENLNLLSQLLYSIISIATKNPSIYEINYIVIFLAEKTIYFNKENIYNKSYLNKIISKNEFFSDSNFWKNLIVKKTEILGEVTINLQMEKIEKERNENAKNEKMLSIVKGIFGKGKNKENEMI
jgi:hypothetical protein